MTAYAKAPGHVHSAAVQPEFHPEGLDRVLKLTVADVLAGAMSDRPHGMPDMRDIVIIGRNAAGRLFVASNLTTPDTNGLIQEGVIEIERLATQ